MEMELKLSESERVLVTELLQREVEELHVEIHHSKAQTVREELRHRREVAREVLERLQPAAVMQ